jgi:16S rRNA G966 N2-methylase RsmD
MALSLIEELPKIVKEGRAEVARILERINSGNALALQTNELVLPSKDVSGLYRGELPTIEDENAWKNRLIYGDNILVMQGLLAGDPTSGLESMRGKIDLIYIDPPFDSKADYRTKITLPNVNLNQNLWAFTQRKTVRFQKRSGRGSNKNSSISTVMKILKSSFPF